MQMHPHMYIRTMYTVWVSMHNLIKYSKKLIKIMIRLASILIIIMIDRPLY